jgi:two-component sensor histidine kinase
MPDAADTALIQLYEQNWTLSGPLVCLEMDGVPRGAPQSRFAAIAAGSRQVPPALAGLLGMLLAAANPGAGGGYAMLQPIWAEEAMHRALCSLRLVQGLGRRPRSERLCAILQRHLVADLTMNLQELTTTPDTATVQCSALLRDVVHALASVFGSQRRGATLTTTIERVVLPGYKRRALVLAAHELVANALLHGFRRRSVGRIDVTLRCHGNRTARLTVADDGEGFANGIPDAGRSIVGTLVALLDAEITYLSTPEWSTVAAITLPLRRSDQDGFSPAANHLQPCGWVPQAV